MQIRILKKIAEWSKLKNPIVNASVLKNMKPNTHRFRVGDWRLVGIWIKNKNVFLISEIESRGQIYKQKR
jgi:mRNA-degrading endonuclease RelE of RelBE toxin-antitoxin system